jgi:hypothetical protein
MIRMVDSGETHNFMKEEVAKELGLQLEPSHASFKAVNVCIEKVIDTTNEVYLNLGDWSGTTSFTIVPIDDFEFVLG